MDDIKTQDEKFPIRCVFDITQTSLKEFHAMNNQSYTGKRSYKRNSVINQIAAAVVLFAVLVCIIIAGIIIGDSFLTGFGTVLLTVFTFLTLIVLWGQSINGRSYKTFLDKKFKAEYLFYPDKIEITGSSVDGNSQESYAYSAFNDASESAEYITLRNKGKGTIARVIFIKKSLAPDADYAALRDILFKVYGEKFRYFT